MHADMPGAGRHVPRPLEMLAESRRGVGSQAVIAATSVQVRPAMPADAPAIAGVLGRAFDDYRRGLGLGAEALARLWQGSLAARVSSMRVAVTPSGTIVGFVTFVRPGEKERYGSRREGR